MSYILDALKRAESERSRGAVPGVHAQPQAAATPSPQGRSRVVWVLAGALALAAVGGGLWWWSTSSAERSPTAPSPVPPVAVVVPTPVQAPAPAAVLPPIPPLPVEPPPPAAPTVPVAVAKAPAAPTTPAAQQPRAGTLAELPDTVRQQLPALAISGATYSENPQYRMVIVNGQVLHEGDTAAPGVVLEKIRQKEVVLRTQGYRYAAPY